MTPDQELHAQKKASVGELLKQGRLRQRLSVTECAKRTHVSPRYLEALEEERWEDLPSESHRIGFLRLYARFLGVPSEELLELYRHQVEAQPAAARNAPAKSISGPAQPAAKSAWYPASGAQLAWLLIAGLAVLWGVYHLVRRQLPEQRAVPIVRVRPRQSPRLVSPRPALTTQKIRLHAEADVWLRAVTQDRLLFEGIMRTGTTKEWTGPGPFELKIGNVKGLSVFWNDQPVDLASGAHGNVADLRLPLTR